MSNSTELQKKWSKFLPPQTILMQKELPLESQENKTPPNLGASPVDAPVDDSLERIGQELKNCTRCPLSKARTHVVLGEGNPKASLVFVGEGPGEQEDLSGRPFVGRAEQLLDRMIVAMGLERKEIFIANIVKCRPPGNRNPQPIEIATCSPFLNRQLKLIASKVIVALGKFSAQTLLQTEVKISQLRGKFHSYQNIPLMPTFHPAYLLRNPGSKREAWEDLKQVATKLGLKIPQKSGQDH